MLLPFRKNPEFIDVKSRFYLIVEADGDEYVVKNKKNIVAAESESKKALKAHKLISGKVINEKWKIRVVVPDIVYYEGKVYLKSKYYGKTMQSEIYSNDQNDFTFADLSFLFNLLRDSGISYRGLLPRNLIINNDELYIIDWEDAIFTNNKNEQFTLLWETNFLLNWEYFFDKGLLQDLFRKNLCNEAEEPELLKYEKVFCSLIGLQRKSLNEIRCIIESFVLKAEGRLDSYTYKELMIHPHDMAHLVSDLFSVDIDVLFDICLYVHRRDNSWKLNSSLYKLGVLFHSYEDIDRLKKGVMNEIYMLLVAGNKNACLEENIKNMISRCSKYLLTDDLNNEKSIDNYILRVSNYIRGVLYE